MLEPIWNQSQQLTTIDYDYANGKTEEIAVGYECSRTCKTSVDGFEYSWSERMLVVSSLVAAASAGKSLRKRLSKVQEALYQFQKILLHNLADNKQKLLGLYADNPKRTTNRPSTEQLLPAFKEINRVSVNVDSQVDSQIEQLSPL